MTASASARGAALPLRKAAVLLVALGEEASSQLLQLLSEAEVKKLSEEIARLGVIGEEVTETVLREFYQKAANPEFVGQGGPEYTRKLLNKALGAEEAGKFLRQLQSSSDRNTGGLESLQKSDPQQLARCLNNEHPQTIALILSHLGPEQAVSLLTSLPATLRAEVTLRMASLDQIAPEVVSRVATAIREKLRDVDSLSREAYGGVRAVADLCNRLDPETAKDTLEGIEAANPGIADAIRNLMFVFDDVLKLDDAAVTEINGRVDRKTLVLALKGTNDQIKQHFTKKMSSRAREMLLEDLDALGPVKIKDVETAQQEVISTIRELERQGVVSLRGSSEGDYVV